MICDDTHISQDAKLGRNIKIWHNVQIREGVSIGDNVSIGKDCYIDKNVIIGNCTKIQNSVNIFCGVTIEDNVFIGPSVTFSNDLYPRASSDEWECKKTTVFSGCSIGANAVIVPGVKIGRYAMIGAGAVITKDVKPYSLMIGNPARIQGYVCSCGHKLNSNMICKKCGIKYKKEMGEIHRDEM